MVAVLAVFAVGCSDCGRVYEVCVVGLKCECPDAGVGGQTCDGGSTGFERACDCADAGRN